MRSNYPFVMDQNVFVSEGGYCWDKGDPGGPTNFGITYIDAAEFEGKPRGRPEDWVTHMKNFPKSEAEQIYRTKYATKCRFDDMPSGLDYTTIDYGINSGVARPPRVIAHLLSMPETGIFTDSLMNAIAKVKDQDLIKAVNAERLHFMHQIRGGDAWARFGGGWSVRVAHVQSVSTKLADAQIPGAIADAPVPLLAQGKATHAVDPDTVKKIKSGTAGSAIASQGAHAFDWRLALALTAGVIVVGAAAYAIHVRRIKLANLTVTLPPGVEKLA